jgi:purine nucleosidase
VSKGSCLRLWIAASLLGSSLLCAQPRRKVIIDQDCSGPGGSNLQTLLVMLQSPDVEVLGITVVSGDQWREEEVAHTLRLLEIIGRTDVPVLRGAEFPLVRSRPEAQLWQQRYGKVAYAGAWDARWWHEHNVVPSLAEGQASIKPSEEDAAHFLVRMVRKYPHEVTIYEGGPMTDLALAITIDPQFPQHAEFVDTPRHEFNFWFDPEAAEVVLRAPWHRIVCTPTDISVKTRLTPEMIKRIDSAGTTLAYYVAKYYQPGPGADFMWDELAAAAWIDPTIITKTETRYMGVDLDKGSGYGHTLTWNDRNRMEIARRPVEIQVDLDQEKFYAMFIRLLSAPVQRESAP